jgi:hypothetical protein
MCHWLEKSLKMELHSVVVTPYRDVNLPLPRNRILRSVGCGMGVQAAQAAQPRSEVDWLVVEVYCPFPRWHMMSSGCPFLPPHRFAEAVVGRLSGTLRRCRCSAVQSGVRAVADRYLLLRLCRLPERPHASSRLGSSCTIRHLILIERLPRVHWPALSCRPFPVLTSTGKIPSKL